MAVSAQSLAAASVELKYSGKVPVFYLPSASAGRGQSGPAATRSKYNLVLAFVEDTPEGEAYLQALNGVNGEVVSRAARTIVVLAASLERACEVAERFKLPYALLADEDGSAARRLIGEDLHAALCVADRYGVAYYLETTHDSANLPPPQTAVEWLDYVQMQCPECTDGSDSRWLGND